MSASLINGFPLSVPYALLQLLSLYVCIYIALLKKQNPISSSLTGSSLFSVPFQFKQKHAILVETELLREMPDALASPFPDVFYIQAKLAGVKVRFLCTWERGCFETKTEQEIPFHKKRRKETGKERFACPLPFTRAKTGKNRASKLVRSDCFTRHPWVGFTRKDGKHRRNDCFRKCNSGIRLR